MCVKYAADTTTTTAMNFISESLSHPESHANVSFMSVYEY